LALQVIDGAVDAMDADLASLANETSRERIEAVSRANSERAHHASAQLRELLPDFPTDVVQVHGAFAKPDDDDLEESPVSSEQREASEQAYRLVKEMMASTPDSEDFAEMRRAGRELMENFEYAETLERLRFGILRFARSVNAWATAHGEASRAEFFIA